MPGEGGLFLAPPLCILSAAVLDYIGIESKERNNDKRLMEGPPVLR